MSARAAAATWPPAFALALASLGLAAAVLLGAGFLSAGAVRLWTATLLALGEPGFLTTQAGAIYPALPFWASLAISAVAGGSAPAPFAADVLAAAAGLALVAALLARAGSGIVPALAAMCLLAANPFVLFASTSGAGHGFLLLFGAMTAAGATGLAQRADARSLLALGAGLGGLVLSHPAGLLFAAGLAPALALLPARSVMRQAPAAIVILTGFAPLAAAAALALSSLVFAGDALAFWTAPGAASDGATTPLADSLWLAAFGDPLMAPVVFAVALAWIAVTAPAALVALGTKTGRLALGASLAALLAAAALAITLGTALLTLVQPAPVLALAAATSTAALGAVRELRRRMLAALAALLLGAAAGWATLPLHATADLAAWSVIVRTGSSPWVAAGDGETPLDPWAATRASLASGTPPVTPYFDNPAASSGGRLIEEAR